MSGPLQPDSPPAAQSVAAAAAAPVDFATVEELVRHRLSVALGGRRGMVEGAVPTLGFTVTYLIGHNLRLGLTVGIGLAVALLAVRLVQRQSVQFVVNSLVGIAIAAVFASKTGNAKDVFLPGILWNTAYAVVMLTLILALPCVVRVAVQYPLYVADRVGWLGVTKIALGWPLQVAALAAMAWLLARGRTPLVVPPEVSEPGPA